MGKMPLKALSHLPLKNIRLLDIGCGGGLLCEPMTRLGAMLLGLTPLNRQSKLPNPMPKWLALTLIIAFQPLKPLQEPEEQFDVVLNMEVVEHVADVDLFLQMLLPWCDRGYHGAGNIEPYSQRHFYWRLSGQNMSCVGYRVARMIGGNFKTL